MEAVTQLPDSFGTFKKVFKSASYINVEVKGKLARPAHVPCVGGPTGGAM